MATKTNERIHAVERAPSRRCHAYFENAQGEQLIFVYDREGNTGTLYHGDLGWEQPRPVVDGTCPTVVLDEAEMLWLRACWMAATAFRK